MKKSYIIVLVFGILCIASISTIFFIKKDDTYSPTVKDIESFVIKNNARYIILYNSEENKYYLSEVFPYELDNNLYYLGETLCNFKELENDVIIISNNEQVVYASKEYDSISDEVYDIKALGLLMISYDSKNYNMQILKRNSEANCILKFKYYSNFIPVDLIET